jgi:hypothetical protein
VIVPAVLPTAMQPRTRTVPAPLPVAPANLPVPPTTVSLMSRNCGFPGRGKQISPLFPELPGEVKANPLG